ncbi:MAG: histidine kinase [Cyclobacteriaceae bacterium]|nr:histidine kinase [Cyclobacteriaceae bacterium]
MEIQTTIHPEVILIMGTSGMLLLTIAIILFITIYQRKLIKRNIAYQKIAGLLTQQELKTTYALLEGQDLERNRIATELHDDISSSMVTLTMFLESYKKNQENAELLDKILAHTKQTSEAIRTLSHRLDSGTLKHFGLETALKDLADGVRQSGSCTMTLAIEIINTLPGEIGLQIYRIVQELINNTLRHSRATRINMEVTQINNEYINIIYEDNGIGFDPAHIKRGLGLQNIAIRIDNMHGSLTIDSKSEKHTTFILEIPLQ